MAASTTGNVYGVYDMAGGSWEYASGNMVNTSGGFYASSAGTISLATKYYDAYTYNTSDKTHGRGKLGDATKESLKIFGNSAGGWYGDFLSLPSSADSWFLRGGRSGDGVEAGIFAFGSLSGGRYYAGASRLVITQP